VPVNKEIERNEEPHTSGVSEVDPDQMVMEWIDSPAELAGQHQSRTDDEGKERSSTRARVQYVDRSQMVMQLIDVEELVDSDHPVRAIWELTEKLDLSKFYKGIKAVEESAGRTPIDPRVLICIWVYAYSTGEGSAREIERLCGYHPAYQWLMGLKGINHHTLSDFRTSHAEALEEMFVQILGVLTVGGLVTLQRVMQDGTKIKALAATKTFRREKGLEECLEKAREQIRVVDEQVQQEGMSKRVAKAKKRAARERLEKLEEASKQLRELQADKSKQKDKEETRVSTTDPDARNMKQADGGYAPSYNVQISTDAANKIIVAVSPTQSRSDFPELINGLEKVEENMGRLPQQLVVDGGYSSRDNIVAVNEKGVDLIGAMANNRPQAEGLLKSRGIKEDFYPQAFTYDEQANAYTCPLGKTLSFYRQEQRPTQIFHLYRASAQDCNACPSKGSCCPKNVGEGRSLMRVEESAAVKEFVEKMKTPAAKEVYKQRGAVAEFPNAWIKEKFGLRQFRLRGIKKVGMEVLWASLTYNIKQWIRLCWKPTLSANA
jgi:transposase